MKIYSFIILLATLVALSGCGPDLVALQSKVGYCDVSSEGLVITIQNVGDEQAAPSKVLVEFSSLQSTTLDVPLIPSRSFAVLKPVQIPVGCFSPDCSFKITVDKNNDVKESDESNNIATGICIG
jgi:hypothetical protein